MKERPILFKAEMVRAILAGIKTQTRRIVKPQPDFADEPVFWAGDGHSGEGWYCLVDGYPEEGSVFYHCPYGAAGDRLWVKESYWGCDLPGHGDTPCVVYDNEHQGNDYAPALARPWALKFGRIPSIHCSRQASRITLEVTGVRVQRLQDITEQDARAEGYNWQGNSETADFADHARPWYANLWDQINGPGAWHQNPWVWAVTFKAGQTGRGRGET